MSGWTFAGWLVAAIAIYTIMWRSRQHQEEVEQVRGENEVLWDQVRRFDSAWAEQRARQAVTN